jgi:hypothetical protein
MFLSIWRKQVKVNVKVNVKVKVKLSLCSTKLHAMKTYCGVEEYLHAFLPSALDGSEWSASCPGRFTPWYPLDRRLSGPQSRSGRRGEEKNSQPPPGIKPYIPPIVQPVAQSYTN